MSDLGPLPRCPFNKRGRHHFAFVIPETSEGDMTMACENCGSIRRIPASGPVFEGSADDLTLAEIARLLE